MLQLLYLGHCTSHCRRGGRSLPAQQNLGNSCSATSTWPLPSNPPKKDQLVPRDLYAGTAHPTSVHHPLHSTVSTLWGQTSHPILVTGTGLCPHTYLLPFSS